MSKPRAVRTTVDSSAFPSWDELVAEAHVDTPAYQLPLPAVKGADGKVFQRAQTVEIPVFDGEQYINIVAAQRIGDAARVLDLMFPDREDREKVTIAMRGAHWPIVDVIATKVLRHFYGLTITPDRREQDDEDAAGEAAEEVGKSDAE